MNLKKRIGNVFMSKFVGTGPSSYKKEFVRPWSRKGWETLVYSVLTHQYTVNNTYFWLHVLVLPNHLQTNIFYIEVHSVCTYIMGYRSVCI